MELLLLWLYLNTIIISKKLILLIIMMTIMTTMTIRGIETGGKGEGLGSTNVGKERTKRLFKQR